MTFSVTVMASTSMKCWWIMSMPAAIASEGWAQQAAAFEINGAEIRAHHSEQHLHQSAFSGAVFAKQTDDFSLRHCQIDAAIGADRAVALVDVSHLQHENSRARPEAPSGSPARIFLRDRNLQFAPRRTSSSTPRSRSTTAAGMIGFNSRSAE